MEWIAHKPLARNTLGGYKNIKRGERLEEKGGMLFYKGSPVCFAHSQVAKEHFAPNQDGRGLERGDITRHVAFGPKLSDTQKAVLVSDSKCRQYLIPDERVVLFNDLFFRASMPELQAICSKLGVRQ